MAQPDTLSETDLNTLARIAGLLIPANDVHGVPTASDPAIMADVRATAQNNIADVVAAIRAFAAIDAASHAETVRIFRRDHASHARVLETLIVRCYYRDDRVMTSLGMDARAPFPKGFEVEQGDWSLLDPVRKMPPLYRPVN